MRRPSLISSATPHSSSSLSLALLAVFGAACAGDMQTPLGAGGGALTAQCEIVSPQSGASFGTADDVDPAQEGIQVDVQVRALNAAGRSLQVTVDDIAVALPQTVTTDGVFRFAAVSLPSGPRVSRLGCSIAGTDARANVSVMVTPACGLRFVEPADGETVSRDALRTGAGGRLVHSAVVAAEGLPAGTPIRIELGAQGTLSFTAQTAVSDGRAIFEVPAYEGASRLVARSLGASCDAVAQVNYQVQAGQCAASINLPRQLNAGADQSAAPGLQTRLCVQTQCPDGAIAQIAIEGGSSTTATVAGGQACADVTIPEGSPTITAQVNAPLQVGVAPPARVCVDVTPPVVALAYPTAGLVLGRRDDRDPSTPNVVELGVSGVASGVAGGCAVPGSRARVELRVNGIVQSTFQPGAAGGAFESVASLVPGRNTIQICGYDSVQNAACTAPVDVEVDLSQPALRYVEPQAGALFGLAGRTSPHQLDVVVEGYRLPLGTSVTLREEGTNWSCMMPLVESDGGARATFNIGGFCAGLGEGAHRLRATAVDRLGNVAETPSLQIIIDSIAPTIAITAPVDGAYVAAESLDVAIRTDVDDGQPITLRVNDGAPMLALANDRGAIFLGVRIPEGESVLTVEATDIAGNRSSNFIRVIRDTQIPVPRFGNLASGQVLGIADDVDGSLANGFQYDIEIRADAEADGARVELRVDDGMPVVALLEGGLARFAAVGLPEGSARLYVAVIDRAGNVGRANIDIAVSTGRPVVRFSSPFDGAAFTSANDADPALPGIQVPVWLTVSQSPALSSCAVVVDAGTDAEARFDLQPEGQSCRGTLTLSEGRHTLRGDVFAQQAGQSVPISVIVDTRKPVVSFVAPSGDALNASSPDVGGEPGFQTNIVVAADDIEVGQGAVLRVTPDSTGIPALYFASFDSNRQAVFTGVTLGDPSLNTLEVQTSDLAGNISDVVAKRVLVDRTPPTVAIASPADGALLGLAADESPDPGFQTSVDVDIGGVELGHTVSLELAAAAAPDAITTYVSAPIGEGQSRVRFSGITLPTSADGRYIVRARVSDSAGNGASHEIRIAIDGAVPSLAWVFPAASVAPTSLCGNADADPVAPGYQATFDFATTGLPNGSAVLVRDQSGALVGSGSVSSDVAHVQVTLADGASTLSASAARPSGNSASTVDNRNVFVDRQGPAIVSFACNGDQNGDGFLSRAEDRDPNSTLTFDMDCVVTFADDSASGRSVQIQSTQGSTAGMGIATGNVAYVSVSLASGAHGLSVTASDACGNAATGSPTLSYVVDLLSPTAAITAPSGGLLLAAADLDPSTESTLECCSTLPGLGINVAVAGDATSIALYGNGQLLGQQAVPGAGTYVFSGVHLPQGNVSLLVEAVDQAGNVGISGQVGVFVDSVPPKVAIASPIDGSTVGNATTIVVSYRDIEPGRGIQLTDNGRILGQQVAAAGDPASTRTASFPVLLRAGSHSLRVDASDAFGNMAQPAIAAVTVATSDPVVSIQTPAENPMVFSRSNVTYGASSYFTLVAATPAAAGSHATLFKSGVAITSASVSPGSPTNQIFFYGVPVQDGETGTFQVRVRLDPAGTDVACPGDDNNFCSAAVPYSVDFTPPTAAFTSPVCKSYWGPADKTAGAFNVVVSSDAADGRPIRLRSSLGGVDVSTTVTTGSATFAGVALTDGDQVLTLDVSDAAGNPTSVTCNLKVDTTAPSISTFTAARATSRRDRVNLTFSMPGNDGATGTALGYEVRYRVCASGAACTVGDAEWSTATTTPNMPAVSAGGTLTTYPVDRLPLDSTIGFGIKAWDSAGNNSIITTVSASTAISSQSYAGPAGETEYGGQVRGVQLSGAYNEDLVLGRPAVSANMGAIRVQYANGRASQDVTAANVGLVSASARFGRYIDAAGDLDQDGYEDLIVGAPSLGSSTCANPGHAFVFFGSATGLAVGAAGHTACAPGGDANCFIQIDAPAGAGVCNFGMAVAGVGRLGTAGSPMIAIGAGDLFASSARPGMVFVYRLVGTRPNVTAELVTTIVGGADDFHFGASVAGVGDVNGDGFNDLVIGVNRKGQTPVVAGRAYIIYGGSRFDTAGTTITITAGGSDPADGVVPLGNMIGADSFGASVMRGGDIDGDGFNDIVIAAPGGQRVYVIRGRTDLDARPSMAIGDIYVITPPSSVQPGEIAAGRDFDGDGLPDIVIGDTLAVHVYRGDATTGVSTSPIATFTQSVSVATGYPVALVRNWIDQFTGEAAMPDVVIGRMSGPALGVKY